MTITWIYGLGMAVAAAFITFLVLTPRFNDTLAERCSMVILAIGLAAESHAVFALSQPGKFGPELVSTALVLIAALALRLMGRSWSGSQVPVTKSD